MRHMPPLFLIAFALLIAAFPSTRAVAQNDYVNATGNPVWGVNIPIEKGFINVANGNVHIEIPVGNEPQRGGSSYTESIVYDSRIWEIINTGSSYSFQPVGGGWTFGGTLYGGLSLDGINGTPAYSSVPCAGSGGSQSYSQTTFTWLDPSRTPHLFAPPIYSLYAPICPYGNTGGISNSTTGAAYAVDGSGYYFSVNQDASGSIYDQIFDQNGNQPGIQDRNGNYTGAVYNHISASGSNPSEDVWTWNNSQGTTVFTQTNTTGFPPNFGGSTYYAGPTYLDVLTIGGATKRYTVNWENINVHSAFGQSAVGDTSTTIAVVQSITLPDGSSYTFNYDSGTSPGNYGELQSMTLPTGATINFGYQNYTDSYQNHNRWVTTYSGGDGSYTFTPNVVSNCSGQNSVGCQESVTVTDGNSNQVVYLLTLNNGAWNSQMDYYNNVNGTLAHVMSTATNYNFQNSCPTSICGGGAEWITASSTTTTLVDTGQTTQTQYVYNNPQYGKPDKVQAWDYYTGTPSTTPTKETDYTYGYFVNGAAYTTKIAERDSSGTTVAQTTYNYDEGTLSPTSGLPSHSNNFVDVSYLDGSVVSFGPIGHRGNLTSVVAGVGTTVTSSSTYDDAGTKLSDTDPNGNQTKNTAMCSDAYPSIVTLPLVVNNANLQASTFYDCSSGLVTSTKDVNSQSTTYSYFTSGTNIGRLQTVTRPDGGTTTYAYPSSKETDQTVTQSPSVDIKLESILDTYGRNYQAITVAPEGSISSETTYDATGRPYSVTTPHLAGSSSSTDGSTYKYYDVLGRSTRVVAPDSSTTTSTYSGNTQTITNPLLHGKQYTYDAFHRLTSVLEPNSSGALTNETDYQYNATASPPVYRMTQVDQWGGAKNSTSPGDRQRVMNYDGLGRLISSTTPEAGTVTYSYLRNGSLCAGDVTRPCSKTDARGVTTQYSYDALNRMISKRYSGDASGTPTSCFQYDTSAVSGASGNLLGRLTNQWTQHASAGACSTSMLTSGGYITLRATLGYDSMGRPQSERQCTPSNCTSTTPYALSYGYDLAGNLTSYSNGLSNTPGAGTNPLTFTQLFDEAGRLQTLTSTWSDGTHPAALFSAPAYAPPGALTNATYGSGITLSRNFNGQLMPTSEIDTINGTAAATSGSATVTITGTEQSK
jgi:YD repeat-containing protein